MRKSSRKPGPEPRIPAEEEVGAAGRALQVRGDRGPADRLTAESGPYSRETAMRILSAAADYDPRD